MHILFLCSEYPPYDPGGIGTFTRALALWLARRGHAVHVLGDYDGISEGESSTDEGVQVHRVPRAGGLLGKRTRLLATRIRLRAEIKRLCLQHRIELIEGPAHTYGGGLWLVPSVAPVVCRIHSSRMLAGARAGSNRSWNDWAVGRGARAAACFVAVSPWAAQEARTHWRPARRGPIVTIPNAVAECFFVRDGRAGGSPSERLVFSGTLNEHKGVRELLDAWSVIRSGQPSASLHLYGKAGRCLDRVLSAVSQPGGRVHWHGAVSQEKLACAFRDARLGIFPSHSETFGLAAAEAAASGVPLVVSDIEQFRWLFGEDAAAAYCQGGDVGSLVAALEAALKKTEHSQRTAVAARGRMQRFRMAKVGPLNEALYEQVIAGNTLPLYLSAASTEGSKETVGSF